MEAIREVVSVENGYINYKLPYNFNHNIVEMIILPIENSSIEYELWSKEELDFISKVDLSTPIEDDEDYSKW